MKKRIGLIAMALMAYGSDIEARLLRFVNNTPYGVNVNVEFQLRWMYPTRCRGRWKHVPADNVVRIYTGCGHTLDYIDVVVHDPTGDKRLRYSHKDIGDGHYSIDIVDNDRYYQVQNGDKKSGRVATGK